VPAVVIAGEEVQNPLARLRSYGRDRTIRQYDLGGAGRPVTLTKEEVVRTRVIASRISEQECEWFVEHSAQEWCPPEWCATEPGPTDGRGVSA
jgi:hypothetical protein